MRSPLPFFLLRARLRGERSSRKAWKGGGKEAPPLHTLLTHQPPYLHVYDEKIIMFFYAWFSTESTLMVLLVPVLEFSRFLVCLARLISYDTIKYVVYVVDEMCI